MSAVYLVVFHGHEMEVDQTVLVGVYTTKENALEVARATDTGQEDDDWWIKEFFLDNLNGGEMIWCKWYETENGKKYQGAMKRFWPNGYSGEK